MGRRRRGGDVCRIRNESAQKLNVACCASSIRRLRMCANRGSPYITKSFWKIRTFVSVLFRFCSIIALVCDTHANYTERPQANNRAWQANNRAWWWWYCCEIVSEYWHLLVIIMHRPIPVAVWSEAWVCGPLACWGCGFESCRLCWCFSLVNVCCVGRGLCDGLIPRPGESYRVYVFVCVAECDQV